MPLGYNKQVDIQFKDNLLNKKLLNENQENDISHRFLDRKKEIRKENMTKNKRKIRKRCSQQLNHIIAHKTHTTKHILTSKLKQHILPTVIFI
jgi:hypothetical protein